MSNFKALSTALQIYHKPIPSRLWVFDSVSLHYKTSHTLLARTSINLTNLQYPLCRTELTVSSPVSPLRSSEGGGGRKWPSRQRYGERPDDTFPGQWTLACRPSGPRSRRGGSGDSGTWRKTTRHTISFWMVSYKHQTHKQEKQEEECALFDQKIHNK